MPRQYRGNVRLIILQCTMYCNAYYSTLNCTITTYPLISHYSDHMLYFKMLWYYFQKQSSRSFQSPPISMQHPQQYLNQNIACHWAISPNLGGQKIKSCPFWLKIGTHGNMVYWRCWLRIQTKIFNIPTPKSIFGQFWAQKFKIVRFVWKLVHMVSQRCWLLFQH